jgi:hypothetical protein
VGATRTHGRQLPDQLIWHCGNAIVLGVGDSDRLSLRTWSRKMDRDAESDPRLPNNQVGDAGVLLLDWDGPGIACASKQPTLICTCAFPCQCTSPGSLLIVLMSMLTVSSLKAARLIFSNLPQSQRLPALEGSRWFHSQWGSSTCNIRNPG